MKNRDRPLFINEECDPWTPTESTYAWCIGRETALMVGATIDRMDGTMKLGEAITELKKQVAISKREARDLLVASHDGRAKTYSVSQAMDFLMADLRKPVDWESVTVRHG